MDREELKKSVTDLSLWMRENGVQDGYCEIFEGEWLTATPILPELVSKVFSPPEGVLS